MFGSHNQRPRSQAHPRSRGEHCYPNPGRSPGGGSSPLARGTCGRPDHHSTSPRLIPARAGNIRFSRSRITAGSAHPRSRGEHAAACLQKLANAGSSPLARGTSSHIRRLHTAHRLIPARAGNICASPRRRWWCAAHPRSRGEHENSSNSSLSNDGSSPLARGTCWCRDYTDYRRRLIPARAGNIGCLGRVPARQPAHPRSRGEHS